MNRYCQISIHKGKNIPCVHNECLQRMNFFNQALIIEELFTCSRAIPKERKKKKLRTTNNRIKCQHIIMLGAKQIYFVKNLHIHPHYTISNQKLDSLINQSKNLGIIFQMYHLHQSYVNDFLIVINPNTPQWCNKVMECYHSMNFKGLGVYMNKKVVGNKKRNVAQVSFGYSSQSYTKYTASSISKPQLLVNTRNDIIVHSMEVLSNICKVLKYHGYIGDEVFNDRERNKEFSFKISKDNIIEGCTFSNQSEKDVLLKHTDSKNCTSIDYNGVICVSNVVGKNRMLLLGYGKHVNKKYMYRLQRYDSLLYHFS